MPCERCGGRETNALAVPLCGFRRLCEVCVFALDHGEAPSLAEAVAECEEEHDGEEIELITLTFDDGTHQDYILLQQEVVDGETYCAMLATRPEDDASPEIEEIVVVKVLNPGEENEQFVNLTEVELLKALDAIGVGTTATNQRATITLGPEATWLALDNPICEYMMLLPRIEWPNSLPGHHFAKSRSEGTIYEFWAGRGEQGQPGYMVRVEDMGNAFTSPEEMGL